jgi:hypothetical protein
MGILTKIRNGFSGQSCGAAGSKIAIVDASAIIRTSGRSAGPRDKAQALKKLATFAEKESLSLTVVLPGPALREAADGDEYRGLTVRYASGGELARLIGKLAKKSCRRGATIVVTENSDAEKQANAAGASVMQTSTFKKALSPGDERGDGNNRKRRSNSGNRPPKKKAAPPEEVSEEDQIVRDLVDPL